MSMAYYPQTDGQTEYINQVLEGYLHIFTSWWQDDWDDLLPLGKFFHNNNVHSLTQQTPFMVDTGRHPRMDFKPQQLCSNMESVNEFVECMAQGLEEVTVAFTKVKDEYTMYYNWWCKSAPIFTPGDRVWLDGSDITTNRPSSELSHQCLGFFVVKACVGHGTYCLALPPLAFTTSTQSSPWSSCPLRILIPSLADNLHHPHSQLSLTVRKSMRSRLY
jgi:hypothetical protein